MKTTSGDAVISVGILSFPVGSPEHASTASAPKRALRPFNGCIIHHLSSREKPRTSAIGVALPLSVEIRSGIELDSIQVQVSGDVLQRFDAQDPLPVRILDFLDIVG